MVLPNKSSLSDDMIIRILNARFHNENPVNFVGQFDRNTVYELIRHIYYGDDVALQMTYTPHVIEALQYYSIIDMNETVDTLLREGKIRANTEISEALSSKEVQSSLNGLFKLIKCVAKDMENDYLRSFKTSKVAKLKLNLN